ncbi:MAG: hypothetical protein R3181_11665 [Rubricoccaceae bacterium]|nr:hypothetical protein [Rubricoccaceae bacterium]
MLIGSADLETYLGVSAAEAARIVRFTPVAERWLRRLKGDLWYDALAMVTPPSAGGGEAAAPVVLVDTPADGEAVVSPVCLSGSVADDAGVTALAYRVTLDGVAGPWRMLPALGGASTAAAVGFRHRVQLPVTGASGCALAVRAGDAAGNETVESVSIRVLDPSGAEASRLYAADALVRPWDAGAVPFQASGATWADRLNGERAEALLSLYHALPHLNLQLDAAGGILTTVWTDTGSEKVQTSYAGWDALETFRAEVLRQAHLLVDGDVRVTYGGAESGLFDAVEGFADGAGALGFI